MATPKPVKNAPRPQAEMPSSTARTGVTRWPWLPSLVLLVITFVAYQSVWQAGFIWDDDDHLTANPAMTAPHGLQMIWSSLAVSRYYPLTLTTFWVQRRLWGLDPMPYHLVNIGVHAINGILIFLLLRRLRIPAAWLAAMLWVIHPVNVESVAWITELKNTQSGVFFFLAVLCFLRFEKHGKRSWYILALVCGLAALLSKPSAVVLPLALLLCVWWERGHWRRIDILRVVPFVCLALGMSAIAIIEQHGRVVRAGTTEWDLGMARRFVVAGEAVWFYATKLVWPAQLTFIYPHWAADAGSLLSWVPLAGVVAAGALLWGRRRESWARAGLVGCGYFVAALLPVLGFLDVFYFRYSFVADHFQYLASVGLIALITGGAATVCRRTGQLGERMGAAIAVVILIVFGTITWNQGHVYRDIETLFQDTLAKNPDCWVAHDNLGEALWHRGRTQDAIWHYEQALRINPGDPEAPYVLGLILFQLGRVPEAIARWEYAVRIRPDFTMAHARLGVALLQSGRVPEAIAQLQEAVRILPDLAQGHNDLGTALAHAGRLNEAIAEYEQAVRLKPDYATAYSNLGYALARLGKFDKAVVQYELAIRIQPGLAEAHNNLGLALFQLGRVREAIGQFQTALRLRPGFAEAQRNLAQAQAGP